MYKKILAAFVSWRVSLYIPLLVAETVLGSRKGYEYTMLPYFIQKFNPLNHFLLYPYVNFDAIYYLLIASTGYTVNAGFFPLFPLLIRFFMLPFGAENPFTVTQYIVVSILINALTLGSMYAFYRLALLDYDKKVALFSVLAMLFFPTAFFLAAFYSESLFLLLSLLSFFFARKGNWFVASVFGILLSATRIVGVAILPALLLEFYLQLRQVKGQESKREFLKKIFPIFLTPLGLILYMIYNVYKWHDALFFVHAQGAFGNNRTVTSIVLLPQTLFRYGKILFSVSPTQTELWVALLEISAVFFALVLFYVAWKKKVRLSYLLFAALAFLIPGSTGTFTGMPRYVLVLFPLFIALALIKNPLVRFLYLALGIILQLALFAFFSKGYYIA